jgi:DNA relaxase NicK
MHHDLGKKVSTRLARCYLWGKNIGDTYPRCHWFNRLEIGEKNKHIPAETAG